MEADRRRFRILVGEARVGHLSHAGIVIECDELDDVVRLASLLVKELERIRPPAEPWARDDSGAPIEVFRVPTMPDVLQDPL